MMVGIFFRRNRLSPTSWAFGTVSTSRVLSSDVAAFYKRAPHLRSPLTGQLFGP